ncbi:MAG: hypothetical protein N2688_01810 [Burkholderiaceae bacterium]|nr:hypothetical protein [Burkholderiaceae bacterium]
MSARTLLPPVNGRTGSLVQQPPAGDLVPGATLDAAANWLPPQFIDAPDWVPTGSVCGVRFGELTILVAEARREGQP